MKMYFPRIGFPYMHLSINECSFRREPLLTLSGVVWIRSSFSFHVSNHYVHLKVIHISRRCGGHDENNSVSVAKGNE